MMGGVLGDTLIAYMPFRQAAVETERKTGAARGDACQIAENKS